MKRYLSVLACKMLGKHWQILSPASLKHPPARTGLRGGVARVLCAFARLACAAESENIENERNFYEYRYI